MDDFGSFNEDFEIAGSFKWIKNIQRDKSNVIHKQSTLILTWFFLVNPKPM